MSESAAAVRHSRSDGVLAYAILRATFGINILLHGVSRFITGHAAFLAYLNHYFEKVPLMPPAILPIFAAVLPPVETTVGALLILGLATRFTLIAGSVVMAGLVFGSNLAQDWNIAGLQLIYCLTYYFLLANREQFNGLSLDGWRARSAEP